MGQKVNAIGLRVGINKTWDSRWYAGDDYADKLHEDFKIQKYLKDTLNAAGVSKVVIERPTKKAHITIHTARPGVVIGKKGADIDKIKKDLSKFTKDEIHLNIVPVAKPELDAVLVAEGIAQQLEKRVAFRRVIRMAVQRAQRAGVLGLKIQVSGRLNGAEIARTEWTREGRVPLHTLRADIDYATKVASTTYGVLGIKVWIFKGEVLPGQKEQPPVGAAPRRRTSRRPQDFEDRSNEE
jgi:small subunit ribosomal protein S3